MRPDSYDRGNPCVGPRREEGDGRLIAEQLEAMPSGGVLRLVEKRAGAGSG
jgi:hypothetical protein